MGGALIVLSLVGVLLASYALTCFSRFDWGRRRRRIGLFVSDDMPWLVRKGFEFEDRRLRRQR